MIQLCENDTLFVILHKTTSWQSRNRLWRLFYDSYNSVTVPTFTVP